MEIMLSLSGEPVQGLGALPFTGVGLIRGEFLLRQRLKSLRVHSVAEELQTYLDDVAREFAGRPVWYRLADLWVDEASVLEGSPYESPEHNPMLGNRGVRRGLSDPALLDRELRLVAEVAKTRENLHLLLPFVQDAEEFGRVRERAENAGYTGRIGAMLEIPCAILDAPSFVTAGASNLLVGLNDLSCLLLGRNRGSAAMKLHPIIWQLVDRLKLELPVAFDWGVAGSLSRALLERAADAGVPYASVHYAEAAALTGFKEDNFPHVGHVRKVKDQTLAARANAGAVVG